MADVFSKEKRSRVMAAIRSKGNRDTEAMLASIFRRQRIKGWRRHQPLVGRPDFIFRESKVAIFVDGCFWHGCPKHGRKPQTNQKYWLGKLNRNKIRDAHVRRLLRTNGWRVLRFWEHDLKKELRVAAQVRVALKRIGNSRLDPSRSSVEIRSK